MFLLYNFLIALLSPLWVPWMLLRAAKRHEKPNWKERQGDLPLTPRKDHKRIWIHAVSVGEVVAASPILKELRNELPDHEIVLSTTTSSGHRTAREQPEGLYDQLVYFPIDVARFQLSAMQKVQPAVVAIMETELWMNFLWAAKTFDAKTLLANGRISDRSFRRSKPIRFFYKALLRDMDQCLMQTAADAERIKALGAKEVEVLGNSKFDQAIEGLDADPAHWRKELHLPDDKPIVVVGSTRGEDEERLVIEAIRQIGLEKVSVIHAPRHLERVPALSAEVEKQLGSVRLRSKREGDSSYVILDTYGELSNIYSLAAVVVIGGGFGEYGGQNLIQPLAHGKPVIHGPHMNNFREVARAAHEVGATEVVSSSEDLAEAIQNLLNDPDRGAKMGTAAAELVRQNQGASKRYAKAIALAANAS